MVFSAIQFYTMYIYLFQLDQVMTQIICDCAFQVLAMNYSLHIILYFPLHLDVYAETICPEKIFLYRSCIQK